MPAQRMETPITVAEAVLAIKNRDYLLPAIQRDFVWTAEKTEALFDSLMRGYPVGSFLFWRVTADKSQQYKFYAFMDSYDARDNKYLKPCEIATPKELTVVLDGQQRLTSLAIGMLGYRADRIKHRRANNPNAYPRKKLYLNLAGPAKKDDDLDREYDFRFLTDEDAAVDVDGQRWFPVREVLNFRNSSSDVDMSKLLAYAAGAQLGAWGAGALGNLCTVLLKNQVVHYFREDEQSLDRVLNIFVRLNSGGIPLSYSDLLLSIASAQWKSDARDAIRGLETDLRQLGEGFTFDKDFILKSALVLTDLPDIRFNVDNFNKENTEAIETGWEKNVRAPLALAVEMAVSLGYNGATLTAYSALIPVAYHLRALNSPSTFCTSEKFKDDRALIRKWLIASLLKSVFGGKTDTLLAALRAAIRNNAGNGFPLEAMEAALHAHGVSLRFSDEELDALLSTEYGRRNTFSILAALYPSLNAQFAFSLDHIYPKSAFKKTPLRAAGFDDEAINRMVTLMNQMSNLQLLLGQVNQEKMDTPFDAWIAPVRANASQWSDYRELHAIPELAGYTLRDFETFVEKRKLLLMARLRTAFNQAA